MRWAEAVAGIAADLAASGPDWEGPEVVGDETDWQVVTGPVGDGLYAGRAGIALFLAAAARAPAVQTGPEVAATARAAATVALRAVPGLQAAGRTGLADGAAGVAWSAAQVGALLQDAELTAAACRTAGDLAAAPAPPDEVDLLGGTAGVVLALLALAPEDAAVRRGVERLADGLAAAGRVEAWGRSWPGPDGQALLGLAHGASGVAVALAEAAAATGRDDLAALAGQAADYERSWFDPQRPGWPDLRRSAVVGADDAPGWTTAWCHGALGIGLARLRSYALRPDDLLLADASAAVQAARGVVGAAGAVARDGGSTDGTLCHGLAGAAELFLGAAAVTGSPEHAAAARRVGTLVLDSHHPASGWPCGVRGAGEAPGLFTGTAGIGLTLLRIADPSAAPSPALPGSGPR